MTIITGVWSPRAGFLRRCVALFADFAPSSRTMLTAPDLCATLDIGRQHPWLIQESIHVGGRSSRMTPSADK